MIIKIHCWRKKTKMVNPQREDGHIDIANEIIDKFCQYRIPGQEWQILWVVLRKTWGWVVMDRNGNYVRDRKGNILKKKKDRIPFSQFSKLTGIPRSKCFILLESLVRKNIIEKSVIQKGNKKYISYGFQKNYEKWKVLPKKVTLAKKVTKMLSKKGTEVFPKKGPSKEKQKETIIKEMLEKSSNIDIQLTDLLIEKILNNDSKAKVPKKDTKQYFDWADHIRLCKERDKRLPEEIRDGIIFSQNDSFWKANILSARKLREKLPTLLQHVKSKEKDEAQTYVGSHQPWTKEDEKYFPLIDKEYDEKLKAHMKKEGITKEEDVNWLEVPTQTDYRGQRLKEIKKKMNK